MKKILSMIFVVAAMLNAAATDRLYIENFSIMPGDTMQVSIMLDNDESYTAFQTDIYLPNGLTVAQEDGEYDFALTSRKASDHTLACVPQTNGALRLLSYSIGVKAYKGNSGALITFNVVANKDFQDTDFILLKNTNFTTTTGTGTTFDDTSCTVSSPLQNLSGDIEIEWNWYGYSGDDYAYRYVTGATVRYTGNENVTLTLTVDGEPVETRPAGGNSVYVVLNEDYFKSDNRFQLTNRMIEVTASAIGYKDIYQSEELPPNQTIRINWIYDDFDYGKSIEGQTVDYNFHEGFVAGFTIDYYGLDDAHMMVSIDGRPVGDGIWQDDHLSFTYYVRDDEGAPKISNESEHSVEAIVGAEGQEDLHVNEDFFLWISEVPDITSYIGKDVVSIACHFYGDEDDEPFIREPYRGSFSIDGKQICSFGSEYIIYWIDGSDYCYVMRSNEDFTVHAFAEGTHEPSYEDFEGGYPSPLGYRQKDILIPARDKSNDIPATEPHGTGSWIVLKDKNGADVWYPLGDTIPVTKSIFGDGEVPFRFVHEGARYGKKTIYEENSYCEDDTIHGESLSALFETGDDFTLKAGYNYSMNISYSDMLYYYGFEEYYGCLGWTFWEIRSYPIYLLGEKMLPTITQLDSIPDEPEPEFIRGDVNGDGSVSPADISVLIDYLLDGAATINEFGADVNKDGSIAPSDISALIDYLLSGAWPDEPEPESAGETFTVNGVSFKMMPVDGGTFSMGGTPEQGDEVRNNEKPVHQVTLSSFNIGQTEVTQELWQAVMGGNPSNHKGDMQRPVEMVSWNDCQTFISRLNELTGKRFRLPTEAEWEYAARGGNKSQGTRYAGSSNIDDVAWYDANSGNTTHPVATKAPNELGVYDMTGNVWEWCQDWYHSYTEEAQVDPTGPATGNNRMLRGGCWNGGTNYDRISFRDNFTPTGSNSSGGLRLALDRTEDITVNGVTFTMVSVKGGTFSMGATEEQEEDAYDNEKPVHQVTLSDYAIGQTEVTQELWQAVMGNNPSYFSSRKGYPDNLQRPVEEVSWDDCQAFIAELNRLTGKTFRLPTEAEWEYAARGGTKSQGHKYAGSDDINEVGWYRSNAGADVGTDSPDYGTHAVRSMPPNELGLYDMTGNVWEWCHDRYSIYTDEAQTNPTGPESGSSHVDRGGGWISYGRYCRNTHRTADGQTSKSYFLGFRLAQ